MTTCNCSEMKWYPYPEKKPEEEGSYWCTYKTSEKCRTQTGSITWMSGDFCTSFIVLAWLSLPAAYTPPPKKKTVRVTIPQVEKALIGHGIFLDNYIGKYPDFIEIEVEE